MVGYEEENTPYFTLKSKRKRKTDAFFNTPPENYTPARTPPTMPDFSGGGEQQGMPVQDSISQLVNLQSKPKGQTGGLVTLNQDPVMTGAPNVQPTNTTQPTSGIYDDWKKPVFGNMPLDKFVQLTGMMANAIAPDEWSGRLGKQMAAVATQADIDRRDYEEREQERAAIQKRYDDAQKEKRMDKALEFAMKTDNPALAKAAYGKMKSQWEEDFGITLPDWNPETTPDVMKQIDQYRKGAVELGLSHEEIEAGTRAIFNEAYGIKDKDSGGVKEYTIGDQTVYLTPDEALARRNELGGPRYKPPSTNVSVTTNVGEKGMAKVAEKSGEALLAEREKAEDASRGLTNLAEAEKLLNSGIITGTGAEYLTNLGTLLSSRLGVNYAKDPVANTQAYQAMMAKQVGEIIKQFGSGTGLSDADREYAEKAAGGKITVTEGAIRRIIAINNKAYRNIIKTYNDKADQVMKKPEAKELPYDLRVKDPTATTGGGWEYRNGKLIKR